MVELPQVGIRSEVHQLAPHFMVVHSSSDTDTCVVIGGTPSFVLFSKCQGAMMYVGWCPQHWTISQMHNSVYSLSMKCPLQAWAWGPLFAGWWWCFGRAWKAVAPLGGGAWWVEVLCWEEDFDCGSWTKLRTIVPWSTGMYQTMMQAPADQPLQLFSLPLIPASKDVSTPGRPSIESKHILPLAILSLLQEWSNSWPLMFYFLPQLGRLWWVHTHNIQNQTLQGWHAQIQAVQLCRDLKFFRSQFSFVKYGQ